MDPNQNPGAFNENLNDPTKSHSSQANSVAISKEDLAKIMKRFESLEAENTAIKHDILKSLDVKPKIEEHEVTIGLYTDRIRELEDKVEELEKDKVATHKTIEELKKQVQNLSKP